MNKNYRWVVNRKTLEVQVAPESARASGGQGSAAGDAGVVAATPPGRLGILAQAVLLALLSFGSASVFAADYAVTSATDDGSNAAGTLSWALSSAGASTNNAVQVNSNIALSGDMPGIANRPAISVNAGVSAGSGAAGAGGGVGAPGASGSGAYGPGFSGGDGWVGGNGATGAMGGASKTLFSGNGFLLINNGSITGGSGGAGGVGGSGGSGGSGGNGYAYNASPSNGGNGGRGGNGGTGGQGAAGGVAVHTTGGAMIVNAGSIVGGMGGVGGAGGAGGGGGPGGAGYLAPNGSMGAGGSLGSSGAGGAGGVAIALNGDGNTINNCGTISGGLANGGAGARANAITIAGNGNTLVLEAGSIINGNVVVTSGVANMLSLGDATNSSFNLADVGALGSATQYQGFQFFGKTGNGTWTLNGASAAVNNWIIAQGTLALGATGSLAGADITNNARFDISATSGASIRSLSGNIDGTVVLGAQTLTLTNAGSPFSGVIGGSGGLTVSGGTQTLSGVNTYTGATTIANGATLALTGSGAITASSGVTANGFFDITGTTAGASIQGLSGTGRVFLGTKTLTLTNSSTFWGEISGLGGVTIAGGTQALYGTNTYSGATNINAGSLTLGGMGVLSGPVNVASGATLNIAGPSNFSAFITGNLSNSGTVAVGTTATPNNTLALTGNYTQNAGATFQTAVSSNASYGKMTVSGTATLPSAAKINVDVASVNTLANGQTLSGVIRAGTLNASTFAVTDNSALFNFTAVKNGNAVDLLTVLATPPAPPAPPSNPGSSGSSGSSSAPAPVSLLVSASGQTPALGAASVFDRLLVGGSSGDMGAVVTALGRLGTQQQVANAVAQTLPLLAGGTGQVAGGVMSNVNRIILARAEAQGRSSGDTVFADSRVWLKTFGSRADQNDRKGVAGFDATSSGLVLGSDAELNRQTRLGLSFAYAKSKVDGNSSLSGTAQKVDVDSYLLAFYGSRTLATNTELNVQADLGQNNNAGRREINFGGLIRNASASYKTRTMHLGLGLGHSWKLGEKTTLTPSLRADYTRLRDQAYSESGAGALNLNVKANLTEALVIGADGQLSHALNDRSWLVANLGASYDTINKRASISSSFAGAADQVFATQGLAHSPWMLRGGLGYVLNSSERMEFSVRYDIEGRSDYTNQTASAKLRWAF